MNDPIVGQTASLSFQYECGDQIAVFLCSGFDDDDDDNDEIRQYRVIPKKYEYTSEGWFELGTRAMCVSRHPKIPFNSDWNACFLTEEEAIQECLKRNKKMKNRLLERLRNFELLLKKEL